MQIGTVIQARVGSTRLPGKVLRDIAGRPMLEHVVRRARAASRAPLVIVATTDRPADDVLEPFCARLGTPVIRGPEEDVLERYRLAAEQYGLDVVARVTSDCPLLDPALIDLVVEVLLADPSLDYVSNTVERTYPRGLDVEAVRTRALLAAAREAAVPYEREHVTPFIWKRPERFPQRQVKAPRDLSGLRLTVDVEEDLALVREVYARLGGIADGLFGLDAVAALFDREPALAAINAQVRQKAVPSR